MNALAGMRSRGIRYCLATIIALTMAFAAKPAEACGCGVYIPLEGEASVSEEHVLIRWDGRTEDIVMTLGVLGSSKEAAVIFPVPTRATVKLADAEIFDALRELTKPRVEYNWSLNLNIGGGAPPPPSVTLLERQTLGPFDVSTLAATDANALGDWLTANGYNLPPEITGVLKPYVAQNWYYIAARLSPGADADELTGVLDPLWITFDYDQIVYPMRPSSLARDTLTVFMYILADHRVQKPMSFGYEDVQFAGWVDPATLEKDSPLAPFVTKKLFLTKIVEQIDEPETIYADYYFWFSPKDSLYQGVEHVSYLQDIPAFIKDYKDDLYRGVGYVSLCLLVPCIIGLILVGSVLVIGIGIKKKRQSKSNPKRPHPQEPV